MRWPGRIATLATHGLVTSDGFAGVRAVVRALVRTTPTLDRRHEAVCGGGPRFRPSPHLPQRGRRPWRPTRALSSTRYGVIFRRLLTREVNAAGWRELTRVYRRLEARGEIRGGRFVAGVSGEQFALPEAVERLREIRRSGADRSAGDHQRRRSVEPHRHPHER